MTHNYKVLSGSELIKLGIRHCDEPRTNEPNHARIGRPAASVAQSGAEKPFLAGLMDKMLSVIGTGGAAGQDRPAVLSRPAGNPALADVSLAEIPLPPARPVDLPQKAGPLAVQAPGRSVGEPAGQSASEPALAEATPAVPLPARLPPVAALSAFRRQARAALPKIITGAQPILPPGFSAHADMDR